LNLELKNEGRYRDRNFTSWAQIMALDKVTFKKVELVKSLGRALACSKLQKLGRE
jgi:hypothetical protein